LVTTRQAREVVSKDTIRQWAKVGRLIPFRYGVYLLAGVPRTEWQPLMAACLAGGPFVAASHRSAALLHGLPGIARPPEPEITVFGDGSLRLADAVTHRSDLLHPDDRCAVRAIPATSPARTLVDIGRYVTEYVLIHALDHAKRRRLCTYEDVAACLDRVRGPGRPGVCWLEAALARRMSGVDAGDSGLEARVADALHRRGLPPWGQQHLVEVDGHDYFLDFAWPPARVGIEVKGDVHLDPSVADRDAERENLIVAAGWRIYDARPTTNVSRLAGQVLAAVRRAEARAPGPVPRGPRA
jgi:hypothetical protein